MGCGIYKLIFPNTNKVYIGQSVDINKRFKHHLNILSKGLGTKKLQLAYNTYGIPNLEIIELLNKEELSAVENAYISKYNSVNNGFNTLEFAEQSPRSGLSGVEGPAALYSREQILEVFDYIISTNLTAIEIEKLTLVDKGIVYYIKSGKGHHWLQQVDPDNYSKYITNKGHGNSAGCKDIVYPNIISPDGNIFNVLNRNTFAKEHNLDSGALGRLLRKEAKSHKGWKLA